MDFFIPSFWFLVPNLIFIYLAYAKRHCMHHIFPKVEEPPGVTIYDLMVEADLKGEST